MNSGKQNILFNKNGVKLKTMCCSFFDLEIKAIKLIDINIYNIKNLTKNPSFISSVSHEVRIF